MHSISNSDDVIDSRDVIERIEELEGERDGFEIDAEILDKPETIGDVQSNTEYSKLAWANEHPDDADELKALLALQDKGEGYSDWKDGAALIRESYFEEYAQELAADIGAIDPNATWPLNCIDWEQAANELKQDYTTVEFDGVTYYVR